MANAVFYLIEPTSISYTGTSATISANGSVSLNNASTIKLNGVFSADYDNYMIVISHDGSSGDDDGEGFCQLMSGGTPASGSNYVWQYLQANNTTVAGARSAATTSVRLFSYSDYQPSGTIIHVYGPYLTQPTALRSVTCQPRLAGLRIIDYACTHNLSTSYDGFYLNPVATGITGRVAVYGMRK